MPIEPTSTKDAKTRPYLLHATVAAVAMVACEFAISYWLAAMPPPAERQDARQPLLDAWFAIGATRTVQLFVLLGLLLAVLRWRPHEIGLDRTRLRASVPLAVGAALLPLAAVAIAMLGWWQVLWPGLSPLAVARSLGVPAQPSAMEILAIALVVGLIVPVVEELFFRGVLHRALTRWLSPAGRTLIVAALFALAHSLDGFLLFAAAGVALGALREWYQSLWAPLCVHAGANLALLTLAVLLAHSGGGS